MKTWKKKRNRQGMNEIKERVKCKRQREKIKKSKKKKKEIDR